MEFDTSVMPCIFDHVKRMLSAIRLLLSPVHLVLGAVGRCHRHIMYYTVVNDRKLKINSKTEGIAILEKWLIISKSINW